MTLASPVEEHEQHLKDYLTQLGGVSKLEISAVLNAGATYKILEIAYDKAANKTTTLLRTIGTESAPVTSVSRDCISAIKEIANAKRTGNLLGDTVAVKVVNESSNEFLPRDSVVVLSVAGVMKQVFGPKRVVESSIDKEKAVLEFADIIEGVDKFKAGAWVSLDDDDLRPVEITSNRNGRILYVYLRDDVKTLDGLNYRAPNIHAALAMLRQFTSGTKPLLRTLLVHTNRKQQGPAADELVDQVDPDYQIIRAAFELFISSSAEDKSSTDEDAIACRKKEFHKLVERHRTNVFGAVNAWHKIPALLKRQLTFSNIQLQGKDLSGAKGVDLDFSNGQFDGARLQNAALRKIDFTSASFVGSDLSNISLTNVNAAGANFSNSNLEKAALHSCNLQKACFYKANVSGADFRGCDLCGVDLSACNANDAAGFANAKYDETTTLPSNFSFWSDLDWQGHDADPYKVQHLQSKFSKQPISFSDFIKQIKSSFDPARIAKALEMLKAERFRLFAEQRADGVIGIVSSQTNPDLVYACRLLADGSYSCCTQNLNPCGGLRGSLCKHILLLVIGLTKAGIVDAREASLYVSASTSNKPALDKTAMVNIFLRHNKAVAGEIDWRPTETIPEDYYAY